MLVRNRVPELMDDPALDEHLHVEALVGLGRLNFASAAHSNIRECLIRCHNNSHGKAVRILDLATGGGDVPISLAEFANSRNIPVEVEASDVSSTAMSFAQKKAEAKGVPIKFFKLDVLLDELPRNYDLVMTSLFTHHLDPPQVVRLLLKMRGASRQAVVIDDLERSGLNLAVVKLATSVLSQSPIVRHDGAASVRASYTTDEMMGLAKQANLSGAEIKRHFPCRFTLQHWISNQQNA